MQATRTPRSYTTTTERDHSVYSYIRDDMIELLAYR